VRRRVRSGTSSGDDGAAVVDFVLVGTLLLFLFLGIVQVGLILHMRNVVTANAAEAARYAANLNVDPSAGGAKAHDLTAQELSHTVADAMTCNSRLTGHLVTVECDGQLPLSFLPLGSVHLHTVAHAVKEEAP
jgi:Flp pilus assembly protein TadG